MVGVCVRIDDLIVAESMVRSDRQVAAAVLLQRIDQRSTVSALAADHVGFTFPPVEFA